MTIAQVGCELRILVVEDEPVLREGLVDLLEGDRHTAEAVGDGAAAVQAGTDTSIDLVLLDVMLPRIGGVEVCRRLRDLRPDLPILMLTARGSEDDKVTGLRAGADDYVTKPFSPRELLARIHALGRRVAPNPSEPQEFTADGCEIDLGRCEAQRDGRVIPLTPKEVEILRWLHRHRARAVSRKELLEQVWGLPGDLRTRTVDMTVAKLRQKIERDPSSPRIIVTTTGVGYGWGDRS